PFAACDGKAADVLHCRADVRFRNRGAEDAVRWLSRIGGLCCSFFWLTCLQQLCQTKVQNFAYALVGKENVGWLDVAMNDSVLVGGLQAIGNLDAEVQQFRERKALLTRDGQAVTQGLAF